MGLIRYPGLLASVVVGASLLSLVAAAYPLFLSRSEGELLAARIAEPTISRYGAGMFYSVTSVRLNEKAPGRDGLLRDRLDEVFARLAADGPHLGPPIRYTLGPAVLVTLPGGIRDPSGDIAGLLFAGTHASANVDLLAGSAGDGVLIPDVIAEPFDLHPGDTIELHGAERKVTVQVGGVYRAFYDEPRQGYWLPWSEQLYRPSPDAPPPLQPILVEQHEVIDLTRAVGDLSVDLGWVAPATGFPLTIDDARDINAYTRAVLTEVTQHRTELGRLFECCGRTSPGVGFPEELSNTEFRSSMPLVLREVERRSASVEGPLRLFRVAGLGVAAAVVAAAAAFAVAGRRSEAALLHARGWGPVRFAARATLESAIPLFLGAAIGPGLGWLLTAMFGPAAPVAQSAKAASYVAAAAAGAATLLVFGIVSGVSFVRTFDEHARKRSLVWVPWEFLAIAGGLLVLARLRSGGALIEDERLDIRRPSALLLAFPLLFVAGFATLGARILVKVLRRNRAKIGAHSQAAYLAAHRLSATPHLTVLLVAAVSLCLGAFVNGQTMVSSLRSTVDAKALVFVGSDVSVLIDSTAPEQKRFPFPITRATRVKYGGSLLPGDVSFDMVGIDPETLVGAAFWDDEFSDEPLDEMIARLSAARGPLPVLLIHGGGTPKSIAVAEVEIPIEVVGRAKAFPGASSDDPVIVVDAHSLEQHLGAGGSPLERPSARTEYWIKGDTKEVLASVPELEAYPLGTLSAEDVKDIPFIAAAIHTFAMLNLVGLAAALLVIGVLVVYLQARQRSRTVSYVLSSRMGMAEKEGTTALVLELAAMLLGAFALGASFGIWGAALVTPLLDPLQTIPPDPLFSGPILVVAWTFVGLIVVAAVGGWFVRWRAKRVDLGELLRMAE
jgi:putative ABC transport system permease protein